MDQDNKQQADSVKAPSNDDTELNPQKRFCSSNRSLTLQETVSLKSYINQSLDPSFIYSASSVDSVNGNTPSLGQPILHFPCRLCDFATNNLSILHKHRENFHKKEEAQI